MNLQKNKGEKVGKSYEKKLFAELKKRDQEAFIRAYDIYVDQIYRFIYFKVGSIEEAQDITSLVFLKTWNYIVNDNLEDIKTLKALIYKIARTTVIDHYRKNQLEKKIEIGAAENRLEIPDDKQDIARLMEVKSDFNIIAEKIDSLKEEYREVIVLRYINELSVGETAKVINKSKSNVRVLTHRALRALKDIIDEDEKLN